MFLSSCGFKVIDQTNLNNFSIKEIEVEGDNNRINFKIKNYILNYAKETSDRELTIKINTKKRKNVKEKNIKNEITKYSVSLESKISIYSLNTGKSYEDTFSAKGNFSVNKKYSSTIDNEKRLIKNLTDQIGDKVVEAINTKTDDF